MRSAKAIVTGVLDDVGSAFRDGWRPSAVGTDELEALAQRRMVVPYMKIATSALIAPPLAASSSSAGSADVQVVAASDSESPRSSSCASEADEEAGLEPQAPCTWCLEEPDVVGFDAAVAVASAGGWLMNLGSRCVHKAVVEHGSPRPACGALMALKSRWFGVPSEDDPGARCGRPACRHA